MSRDLPLNEFSPADVQALEPVLKVGLLATVNREGQPHLTLISSLRANAPSQLTWGQFTEGLSKAHIRDNPRAGFLVLTLDKKLLRGQATFTHTARQGPEYDWYNNTPMFRYNAYFGIHTVYFMDLVAQSGCRPLPMGEVVAAAVETMLARYVAGPRGGAQVLNGWTRALMNKLDNLKFLAYVGADGYPVVLPVIQAQAAGSEHVLFAQAPYSGNLGAIPPGASVAVFGMSLAMEDVLLRGEFLGIQRRAGVPCGVVRINWVYNSMPPNPGQIYPRPALEPVTAF